MKEQLKKKRKFKGGFVKKIFHLKKATLKEEKKKKKRHVENSFGGENLFWKQKIFKREKAHGFYFEEKVWVSKIPRLWN